MADVTDTVQYGKWQPIETAPAVGKKRLVFWTKYGKPIIGYRIAGTKNVISQESGSMYVGTYWQPLPTSPEAK